MQDYPPVSQEHWVWNARLATAPIFSSLWQTHQSGLISSMDRVCFVPPTQLLSGKTWWHLDQSRSTRIGSLQCVQGMLVLEDIDESDVALQVMAGTQKYHGKFFTEHMKGDTERLGTTTGRGSSCPNPFRKMPKGRLVKVSTKRHRVVPEQGR